MWLSLSQIITNAMALHKRPVEQRQVEIPHFRWNFRVNFRPSNSSPFWPRIVVVTGSAGRQYFRQGIVLIFDLLNCLEI